MTIAIMASACCAEELDFSRHILPILSDKCFVCHGPDAEDGLVRLDSATAATSDLGGYSAINVEDLEKSELLARISSSDDPMPPLDADKQLSEQERDWLRRWVLSGAKYQKHWAYVAPKKSADHSGETPKQIDSQIKLQLDEHGISWAPKADKATIARRAALVLTGMPPGADIRNRFLADDTVDAYDRLIEELLAEPTFGEHQARYWLDAIRYGDTHGLHLDNRRGIYPYRDWVVRAFNNNLPLDQFIQWQVAGDLLAQPSLEQLVATGFVRMNPSTGEGGAISAEFQAKNNFDRVETFGTVFLGMSLTCARCHTHKYDPIQQSEYYRLMAFFNNTAEPALDGNSYTYGPTVRVPSDQAQWEQWETLLEERQGVLEEAGQRISSEQQSAALEKSRAAKDWKTQDWQITKPSPIDQSPNDKSSWSSIKGLPGSLSGRAARGKLPNDQQAVWIRTVVSVPSDQSLWISFSGDDGSCLYVDEAETTLDTETAGDSAYFGRVTLAAGKHTLKLKSAGFAGITKLDFNIANAWDSLASAGKWDACAPNDQLLMLADPSGPLFQVKNQDLLSLATRIQSLQTSFTTSLVARELPQPRETRVLSRGEYDQPQGEALKPGVMAVLNPLPEGVPRNRLGLAEWLTTPDNPLVARVLVNRIWQRVFGYGLVRSPEDFGLQGQYPTHPKLLDWLAVELIESGWDLKHVLKLLVTSQTFQQSSQWRDDVDDPENRLFARGPSYRLDAEVIRDVGLWASGVLDPSMGGEGVKPYQPSGMWKALAHPASNTKQYQKDSGNKLYRRSLYVYWKRTSPHPMMTLFDAPDRESSCVRRSRTNTALQSLGLLNETQRIEMARVYAASLLKNLPDDQQRLNSIFQKLACRLPSEPERKACLELLEKLTARYRAAPNDAKSLLTVGDYPTADELDSVQHAAWTQVCITVLASDLSILLY